MIESVVWYEKYRPTTLEQVALSDENRALLQSFLDRKEIPHLLLHGPAGTGKTTVSKILTDNLDAAVLLLNASKDRGIDVVRNEIGQFVKTMGFNRWRIVFLDEADAMTPDAQFAMRNLIETYSDQARFILTCNHLHRIIDPLQSRCTPLLLSEMPLKERHRVLSSVLQQEGITGTDPVVVLGYAERYRDMRRLLTAAQKAVQTKGKLVPVTEMSVSGLDIFTHISNRRYDALKGIVNDPAFDCQQGLRDTFWAIPDNFQFALKWRATLSQALTESTRGVPDQVIHFLGTCCSLMT